MPGRLLLFNGIFIYTKAEARSCAARLITLEITKKVPRASERVRQSVFNNNNLFS